MSHYCLQPSACGVSGFWCANAIEQQDRERAGRAVQDDGPAVAPYTRPEYEPPVGAVQDDGLDVERLRDAIGSVFGYLARPDADKVAAAYRAAPALHEPKTGSPE